MEYEMSMSALPWGCLGAALPEIFRQYDLRHQPARVPFSYYVRSALFVLGSGLLVSAFPGDLPALDAIYQGFAAPIIVNQGAMHIINKRNGPSGSNDDEDELGGDASVDNITNQDSTDVFVKVRPDVYAKLDGWPRFFHSL
jgi:hypothetical protein